MKYFSVSISDNLEMIGHYPQTKIKTEQGDDVRVDGYLAMRYDKFPDFVPNYKLELHPKAIPTNFLPNSPASFGWVVDSKLKIILESHELPKHHFYPIKVYHKNQILDYYWLHYIIDDFFEFIDKKKSYGEVFEFTSPFETIVEQTFPILSWDQVLKVKKSNKYNRTRIGKIIMKKNFPKYDVYETRCISYSQIISQKLKEVFEKEGITGMEIKPFDKFIIDE